MELVIPDDPDVDVGQVQELQTRPQGIKLGCGDLLQRIPSQTEMNKCSVSLG